ncbi:MAG: M23 family metallopeptidase [Gemmatimonadota bacterium]
MIPPAGALRPLVVMLLLPGVLPVGASPLSAQEGRETIPSLREYIRSQAARITVDGFPKDWGAVPRIPDASGDVSDPSRDLTSATVVPTDDAILILLETRGAPSREDRAFWINLDVTGNPRPDVQVGLSPGGRHYVRTFDEEGRPRTLLRLRFTAAVDAAVEVAVPVTELERILRGRGPLKGNEARDWVRVVAFTWSRSGSRFGDFTSAASYRIAPGDFEPPATEEALPAGRLPVSGRWFVSQGPTGSGTHRGLRAWDLTRTDEGLSPSDPVGACEMDAFFSWDRTVQAPGAALVRAALDDAPDAPPCTPPAGPAGPAEAPGEANEVVLQLPAGNLLRLSHLRQGSVQVRAGEPVQAGLTLGRVGNSGPTSGPHLHLESLTGDAEPGGPPLSFGPVRVLLNPVDADPWARVAQRWVPRAGFFVEPAPSGHD